MRSRHVPGALVVCAAWACGLVLCGVSTARAAEPVQEFLDALRQRQMFDIASDYLEGLRTDPTIDAETKAVIPYEQARLIVDDSSNQRDAAVRMKELEDARAKFEEFLQANAEHAMAGMARLQLGNVLVQRGRTLVEKSRLSSQAANKPQLLTDARAEFKKAYEVFDGAVKDFEVKYKGYPKIVQEQQDPKLFAEKRQALTNWVQSMIYAATAVYEEGKSHEDAAERNKLLETAAARYKDVYEKFRNVFAGLYAGMLYGRCYQEIGDLKRALGIYDEILVQPDEEESFRLLQAKVLRLAMECWNHESQKKYEESIKRGDEWLKNAPGDMNRTDEGLAVQFMLAQAMHLAVERDKEKPEAGDAVQKLKNAIPGYARVVASKYGEFQDPARKLLVLYRPKEGEKVEFKTFAEARDGAKEQLDLVQEFTSQIGEERKKPSPDQNAVQRLMGEQLAAGTKAIELYRLALDLADAETPIEDVNFVRYFLCYLYYTLGDFPRAAVMGEWLARNYPQASIARNCANIAMAGFVQMYNSAEPASGGRKPWETEQMVRIATYIAETWPEQPEAADAWMTLGDIAIREKNLEGAVGYFDKIPEANPNRSVADLKSGQSYWTWYLQTLRQEGVPDEKKKELSQKAEAKLGAGVAARRKQLAENDPAPYPLLAAELSLAQLFVNDGRATESVAMLEKAGGPLDALAKNQPETQVGKNFPVETYKAALRAYVAVQEIKKAEAMMAALEQRTGGADDLTKIYIQLGYDIENQVRVLQNKVKSGEATQESLTKMLQGFEGFLSQLKSKGANLPLTTMNWIATTFKGIADGLKEGETAQSYYGQAAQTYTGMITHPEVEAKKQAAAAAVSEEEKTTLQKEYDNLVIALKLQIARCLRGQGKFKESGNELIKILLENEFMIEVQEEAASNFEQWAAAENNPAFLTYAMFGFKHKGKLPVWGWKKLATTLQRYPKFQETYLKARYHYALNQYKKAEMTQWDAKALDQANQIIANTKYVVADLGGGQMQADFDALAKLVAARQAGQ